MLDGNGRLIYANGDFYIGDFFQNKKHGTGEQYWTYGKIYKGEWVDDKREGEGVITFRDGSKDVGNSYIGSFKNNKKNGHGTYK